MMEPDLWSLYMKMYRSRAFEDEVARLWHAGRISGEMHLGVGEEALVAGVLDHLKEGDALALDHRSTPPMVMRGVDPVLILMEMLGHTNGLCKGYGGHMHLFSREHLVASSGIVGAAGPTALGFALAGQYLRSGSVAVAFFGEGAVNQGMLMESFNLAVGWRLPVLFVCKNNHWAITTRSADVTGGNILDRAKSYGLINGRVDGTNVVAVWRTAGNLIGQVRQGSPAFLFADVIHLEGHFMGDPLLRIIRNPLQEGSHRLFLMTKALFPSKGLPLRKRLGNLGWIIGVLLELRREQRTLQINDPLIKARHLFADHPQELINLEQAVRQEIAQVVAICDEATLGRSA